MTCEGDDAGAARLDLLTMTPSERDALICEVIATQLAVSLERVLPTSLLVNDLRADLVTLTQLALALEESFEIEIVDAEWIDLTTVAEIIGYVSARVESGRQGARTP